MFRLFAVLASVFIVVLTSNAQPPLVVPDSNTVALWHFDEGAGGTLYDGSAYHNDGQIHQAEWASGMFGQALHFNGQTSHVALPNSISLRPQAAFTLEAWIAIDASLFPIGPSPFGSYSNIVANMGPYPNGGGYAFYIHQPSMTLQLNYRGPNGDSRFSNPVPLNDVAAFHHVAATYEKVSESSATVKIYVDGELKDSVTAPSLIQYDQTPTFYVGTNMDGLAVGGPGIREFAGRIDEVRISNIARQASEFGASRLIASRSHVNFGVVKVLEPAVQNVSISNTSFTESLHVDSIASTDPHFTTSLAPFVLPPLSSHSVVITYTPTDALSHAGVLSFHASEAGVPPAEIQLEGKGFTIGAAPVLSSIRDVQGDQGRQVRLRWFGSFYDSPSESLLVNEYSVWRRVDDAFQSRASALRRDPSQSGAAAPRSMLVNGELWDFITMLPAVRFSEYAYVAPTLVNASQSNFHWSVFRVAGHATNGDFFFSDPDSGYSYDNNFPPPPPSLQATLQGSAIALTWNPSTAPDVEAYNVYRSTSPNVVPSVFFRIATTTKAAFDDSTLLVDSVYYYTVTAVDSSGNEGEPSNRTSGVTLLDVQDELSRIPAAFTLRQNYPNPFNPVTAITYGVPTASRVRVSVFDLLGRMVATLADGDFEPGFHTVRWTADAASGVYFYRVDATSLAHPSESIHRTGKMLLMK